MAPAVRQMRDRDVTALRRRPERPRSLRDQCCAFTASRPCRVTISSLPAATPGMPRSHTSSSLATLRDALSYFALRRSLRWITRLSAMAF
ncbi:unnamed protein product, partial [Iphiclides podalirius]